MRILQYNIWNGCHDAERNKQLKEFLIKESYDIIGFNELKYWNDVDFIKAMKACGYNHCAFLEMSSSLYSIGIASKTPITLSAIRFHSFAFPRVSKDGVSTKIISNSFRN